MPKSMNIEQQLNQAKVGVSGHKDFKSNYFDDYEEDHVCLTVRTDRPVRRGSEDYVSESASFWMDKEEFAAFTDAVESIRKFMGA